MTLDAKRLAYASAAFWGGSALLVGLINLSSPDYGREVLELLGSVYPGYHVEPSIESVLVLTGYALADGAVCGWVFGWLYNRLGKR